MIERLVSQSLKAKTELQLPPDGVRWSIVAPLVAIASNVGVDQATSPLNPAQQVN